MPSNHLILCHLLLPDETPVAVTETPPVFPSMMVIPSSWDDPFTTVWIKIIRSCISGHSVQGPSLDSSGCLEMLTLSFCPPEMGFILTSPSRDVLCLLYIKPAVDHLLFPVIAIKLLMCSFILGKSGHLPGARHCAEHRVHKASDRAVASGRVHS